MPTSSKPTEDPVLKALAEAPLDDEPETEEERAAVEEYNRNREAIREKLRARGAPCDDAAVRDEMVRLGLLIPHDVVRRLWLEEP
ncbi:MAG TPA: hypothetical protein VGJ84_10895 [Polyangiaceae bacterium]|jgi:hypothetical protein